MGAIEVASGWRMVVIGAGLMLAQGAAGADKNGFDLSSSLVPVDQIHAGGPPRDGIPAIDRPRFIAAAAARRVADDAPVLGLARNGIARAYPIAIMNWHEIVNDRFGPERVVVTFCPLCGTGVAFAARVNGRTLDFGVSGLLYNSDVLLYDRESASLWSQLMRRAISGPMIGTRLEMLPLVQTTWAAWREAHPDTEVLSRQTGFRRDYDRDPYAGYVDSDGLYFPVARRDPRYHPKERVLGVELDGRFKAYPRAELSRTPGVVRDRIGGEALEIRYDAASGTATAHAPDGSLLPAVSAFWFAWYAFHPETEVYRAPTGGP